MYKRAADGVVKKGKTDCKHYGNSGPTVSVETGPKKHTVGKTNADMKKMGRNMAKVANQKRG